MPIACGHAPTNPDHLFSTMQGDFLNSSLPAKYSVFCSQYVHITSNHDLNDTPWIIYIGATDNMI